MAGPRSPELSLFSADSHVIENPGLWGDLVPEGFFRPADSDFDPTTAQIEAKARLVETAKDGVHGEVLYPTLGLKLFGLDDPEQQASCFRRYNEWLAEFCAAAPDQLIGIGLLAAYDIDTAIAEARNCAAAGMKGVLVWQTPPPELSFSGTHYDPLWAELEKLKLPVSLHILSGFNYSRFGNIPTKQNLTPLEDAIERHRGSVNLKLLAATDALLDLTFSGVLDRFPSLRVVIVENEIGWLPFVLDQYDYYYNAKKDTRAIELEHLPSEYFGDHVFATFFRDPVGTRLLDSWGVDGCMWSNDYPHPNSTWPNSRAVVEQTLGYLPADVREKLVRTNALKLYNLE
jgi:predicted TIM-barrel fold metal-dependent hydrolase